MASVFHCRSRVRRDRVGKPTDAQGKPVDPQVNGIDYLEVDAADQRRLRVHFFHPLPGEAKGVPAGPALAEGNVRIEGGVRITGIGVRQVSSAGRVLTVVTGAAGDFSSYTLRLAGGSRPDDPPPGFDTQLSSIDFSFKASCPSEFDCRLEATCPPRRLEGPAIDYLAKDFSSFRRLLLDRLSTQMPGRRERSPADLTVTLVELLAYVGDHLSYAQDAVGTEAYLGTARRRVSVRRHARLLDYAMHDGCNARAWVVVKAGPGAAPAHHLLRAKTRLLAAGGAVAAALPRSEVDALARAGTPVFETLHDLALVPAHDEIAFHTWSDGECCLPRGATRATLLDEPKGSLQLAQGDVLILEEVLSPTNGTARDADPSHRHAVRLASVGDSVLDPVEQRWTREIRWHEEDALPFPLCISTRITDRQRSIAVARGNVVLADHGLQVLNQPIEPERVPEERVRSLMETDVAEDVADERDGDRPAPGLPRRPYRPTLLHRDLVQATPSRHPAAVDLPAAAALRQDPADALPALSLLGGDGSSWRPSRDLLGASRFDELFVAEVESDGTVTLRFGDDVLGKRPLAGTRFRASYRLGGGRAGNVGAESISTLGSDDPVLRGAVLGVRNPLAAVGGVDPESAERVRQYAPQAFRVQKRAVTEEDYARAAAGYPGVQRAAATLRWTGSWYTMFVTVDRKGGASAVRDPDFASGLRRRLEEYRIAGYDLEIADPVPVALDIALLVCVRPGLFNADVKRALLAVFSRDVRPDRTLGFFHPDRFTFGQPLPLSRVVEAAMTVPGAASVEVRRFQRFGRAPNREIEDGRIAAAPLEVLRLDNDPNAPENGRIDLDVQGGL